MSSAEAARILTAAPEAAVPVHWKQEIIMVLIRKRVIFSVMAGRPGLKPLPHRHLNPFGNGFRPIRKTGRLPGKQTAAEYPDRSVIFDQLPAGIWNGRCSIMDFPIAKQCFHTAAPDTAFLY